MAWRLEEAGRWHLDLGSDAVRIVPTRTRDPGHFGDPVQYLIQHGYTQLTTYQPASRFWPFQWIEDGWLLALSLLLLAATVWLVRRRAA